MTNTIIIINLLFAFLASAADWIPEVSMIKLIANPKLYQGKIIETSGYYYGRNEMRQLFFSMEDARHATFANSIQIDDFDKSIRGKIQFDKGFVILRGRYYAPPPERDVRNQNGLITDVTVFIRAEKKF